MILIMNGLAYAHDTTHIHPLITAKIAKLIKNNDAGNNSYEEIYRPVESPIYGLPEGEERLYWGTDFDLAPPPVGFPVDGTQVKKEDHLLDLDEAPYTRYSNVIDGVVQEDIPATKVLNHFYQAETGKELTLNNVSLGGVNSANTAMKYFNEAIEWMGGYSTNYETPSVIATGSMGSDSIDLVF